MVTMADPSISNCRITHIEIRINSDNKHDNYFLQEAHRWAVVFISTCLGCTGSPKRRGGAKKIKRGIKSKDVLGTP